MRALTHLFGSTDGYRTLAHSPGISEDDEAALAALGFGSPRTDAEFESLELHPCIAGRPLPSHRYGITRIFAGEPDVAGRRTVERRTLLLTASQWAELAASDLRATLEDPRNWSRETFVAGETLNVVMHPRPPVPLQATEPDRRVYDGLLSALSSGRCATFPSSAGWSDAVLRLPTLLPASQALPLGWGVELWAIPNFVRVATLRGDAGSRGFAAATSGAFRHPEVLQLGRIHAPQHADDSHGAPMSPMARPSPIQRLVPAMLAAIVMLAATLVIVLATLGRAGSAKPRGERTLETGAREVSAPVPVPQSGAPVQSGNPAAPTPAASQSPAAPEANAVNGAATTAPAPLPSLAPESQPPTTPTPANTRSDPRDAFGSGASDPMRDMGGDASRKDSSAERPNAPTTPASPSAPVATPAPVAVPAPSIPPPPADSTPWDAHVALLRQAIDLHAEARAESTKQGGAALVPKLAKQANALLQAHREIERSGGKASSTDRLLVRIDAVQGKRGLTDLVLREQLAQTFPPLLIQRMLLLSGRFEISLAIQDLVRRNLIDTSALPNELRRDVKADGWPDQQPWVYWFSRDSNAQISSAIDGARYMASEFDRALNGHPGTRNAQDALESIANRRISEAQP